ncbi:MAG: hypothetical protein RLZZ403_442 [Pseudomonadota bacterium]|jgi:hypothetical protein
MTMRLAAICTLLCLASSTAAQEPALRNNLFGAPPAPEARAAAGTSPVAGAAPAGEAWQPALKAILFAGKQSLINLNGFILKTGDEINGFKVWRINETDVVLKRRNDTITLKLDQAPGAAGSSNVSSSIVTNSNEPSENSTSQPKERASSSE